MTEYKCPSEIELEEHIAKSIADETWSPLYAAHSELIDKLKE